MWLHHIRILLRLRKRHFPKRPIPCSLCGFAGKTVTAGHGYLCFFYDQYISAEEAADPHGALRKACVHDGNNLRLRVKGVTPIAMLEWRVRHADWYMSRLFSRIGALVGVTSLALGALALWLR